MHYIGMLAYRINGDVIWHSIALFLSVMLATALGSLALMAMRNQLGDRVGRKMAAVFFSASIVSLHFTGMSAIEVTPVGLVSAFQAQGVVALALATALAGGLVVAAGAFSFVINSRNLQEAREIVDRMGRTDLLTGLPNRASAICEIATRTANRQLDGTFAVILMEIANIDAINERFGEQVGDLVIQAVANRLREARRAGLFLARTSSFQFCGAGAVDDRNDMLHCAWKFHSALSAALPINALDIRLDIRVGCAAFPEDARNADDLLRKAHVALARAKADPISPIALHDEAADANVQRRLSVLQALGGALERGEFELVYQPQIWIPDQSVIGYEALLRWNSVELGKVSPAEFIPIAERTGSILQIGGWAMRAACKEAASWPHPYRVAVNVSPLQLRQPDLPEQVHEALMSSGLSPDRLEIELTESLLIEDRARALHVLRRIRSLGVRLALDDFGAGYSSLEILRKFPFDKVKLDKSLVDDIEVNPRSRAILHAMLELGRKLSIPVLVEGVETERQLAILRQEGCNKVQGYLTGRPSPASVIHASEAPVYQKTG